MGDMAEGRRPDYERPDFEPLPADAPQSQDAIPGFFVIRNIRRAEDRIDGLINTAIRVGRSFFEAHPAVTAVAFIVLAGLFIPFGFVMMYLEPVR